MCALWIPWKYAEWFGGVGWEKCVLTCRLWSLSCDTVKSCRWLPCSRGTYHLHLWGRHCWLHPQGYFCLEDGGDLFLQNIGYHMQDFIMSQPKRHFHNCENFKSYISTDTFFVLLIWYCFITCFSYVTCDVGVHLLLFLSFQMWSDLWNVGLSVGLKSTWHYSPADQHSLFTTKPQMS
jgi:hypothetical protein